MSPPNLSPTEIARLVRQNRDDVRQRIDRALERSGRPPGSVQLVAVTKYAQPAWVAALLELGERELGENRPQQLEERAQKFPGTVHWHLIGHLQRNKVRRILPITRLIHSLDSLSLAESVDRIAGELGLTVPALLEVNVSGEASKHGFTPDDVRTAWPTLRDLPHVQVRGLMSMAPYSEEPETARPVFRELRQLRDELADGDVGRLPELSMGMTGDFEVAIEEGATLVRIGSALWQGLDGE
jgi:pyridoxal phosphate enzyme (YggS family)